ncbi:hypothetical protein ONA91_37615 [Micromonospora sp. DR5-3]|nr:MULTISPECIES: hypothetical protein [unclassified Micromonospora]MCW3820164.1 hypothetical protein [Micromonospora sp. DR5-3]
MHLIKRFGWLPHTTGGYFRAPDLGGARPKRRYLPLTVVLQHPTVDLNFG